MPSSSSRPLPKRSDSLKTTPDMSILSTVQDELRDMRRVQAYGQEDDLKVSLGRMIQRVEEFSSLLLHAQKSQTELETSLKLARSNLQLALANNEMLEEALKRDSISGGRDVGWHRGSDDARRRRVVSSESTSDSMPTPSSSPPASQPRSSLSDPSAPSSPAPPSTTTVAPQPQPAPSASQESRFFRFRFGSTASSSSPNVNIQSQSRPQSPLRRGDASHLTSASVPSLVPHAPGPNKREEELAAELEAEKKRYEEMCKEKKALEAEIENLSQALFEEANKMVAIERIKCAEIEEELRVAREEREALKGAMRVIELENGRLKTDVPKRSDNTTPTQAFNGVKTNGTHSPPTSLPASSSSDSDVGNDTIVLERSTENTPKKSPLPEMPAEDSPWADSTTGIAH